MVFVVVILSARKPSTLIMAAACRSEMTYIGIQGRSRADADAGGKVTAAALGNGEAENNVLNMREASAVADDGLPPPRSQPAQKKRRASYLQRVSMRMSGVRWLANFMACEFGCCAEERRRREYKLAK